MPNRGVARKFARGFPARIAHMLEKTESREFVFSECEGVGTKMHTVI